MFVLKSTSLENETSKHYWMNKNGEDFLRYIPGHFGVPKESVRVWMFDDGEFPFIEALLKSQAGGVRGLDLSEDGVMKVVRVDTVLNEITQIEEESVTVLRTVNGVEIGWPYSEEWSIGNPENGKFLGHKEIEQ